MRKFLIPFAAIAVLGLAACGQKAKNEGAEANEVMSGDSNTMGEAVADTNAAEAAAFNSAEQNYAGNDAGAEDAGDTNEIYD